MLLLVLPDDTVSRVYFAKQGELMFDLFIGFWYPCPGVWFAQTPNNNRVGCVIYCPYARDVDEHYWDALVAYEHVLTPLKSILFSTLFLCFAADQ